MHEKYQLLLYHVKISGVSATSGDVIDYTVGNTPIRLPHLVISTCSWFGIGDALVKHQLGTYSSVPVPYPTPMNGTEMFLSREVALTVYSWLIPKHKDSSRYCDTHHYIAHRLYT